MEIALTTRAGGQRRGRAAETPGELTHAGLRRLALDIEAAEPPGAARDRVHPRAAVQHAVVVEDQTVAGGELWLVWVA